LSALAVSLIVFVCVFAGALAGFALRRNLPEHHFSQDSKTVVQLGTGLIATMAALVLGLLTASAKDKYDVQSEEVKQTAANIVLLDRALARYGPEAQDVRDALRSAVAKRVATWNEGGGPIDTAAASAPEAMQERIGALVSHDDAQAALKARALDLATTIASTRWLVLEQSGSSVSWPFLVVMVFWLTALFMSFGMMAEANATIVSVLFVCALSVSIAIFLIFELDQPFRGFIHISSAPLQFALDHLGQ
jgi:Protein of unknown function (DUF4239)